MFTKCKEFLILLVVLNACSTIKDSPNYQLADGQYKFRQTGIEYKKAFLHVEEDSIKIFLKEKMNEQYIPDPVKDQFFIKRSFDLDVITVPFKFRPITAGLPRQLITDFNGSVYIGYRIDRVRLIKKETPAGIKQSYRHRGLTVGGFGGLGSTSITPWTTNNQTADEYNGLVLSRGLAVMVGLNNLTVGVGVGWDYLTDRDKHIWIYQNKPWYGLTLGLNLN